MRGDSRSSHIRRAASSTRASGTQATEGTSTLLRSGTANAVAQTLVLCIIALLRARRGDPDPLGPLAEAQAIAAPTGELQHLLPIATAAAEIAWLEGGAQCADVTRAATDQAMELATATWRHTGAERAGGVAATLWQSAMPTRLTSWVRMRWNCPAIRPVQRQRGRTSAATTKLPSTLCSEGFEADHRRALAIFQGLTRGRPPRSQRASSARAALEACLVGHVPRRSSMPAG